VRTPPEKRDLAAIETSIKKTTAAITILDAQLAQTAYVAGDQFSMGDIPVGVFGYRFHALVKDRPPLPHFERWFAAISARPAFRDHILSMPLD
jgi:glutathione S-transferase